MLEVSAGQEACDAERNPTDLKVAIPRSCCRTTLRHPEGAERAVRLPARGAAIHPSRRASSLDSLGIG